LSEEAAMKKKLLYWTLAVACCLRLAHLTAVAGGPGIWVTFETSFETDSGQRRRIFADLGNPPRDAKATVPLKFYIEQEFGPERVGEDLAWRLSTTGDGKSLFRLMVRCYSRAHEARARTAMEEQGLISMCRFPGLGPTVTILPLPVEALRVRLAEGESLPAGVDLRNSKRPEHRIDGKPHFFLEYEIDPQTWPLSRLDDLRRRLAETRLIFEVLYRAENVRRSVVRIEIETTAAASLKAELDGNSLGGLVSRGDARRFANRVVKSGRIIVISGEPRYDFDALIDRILGLLNDPSEVGKSWDVFLKEAREHNYHPEDLKPDVIARDYNEAQSRDGGTRGHKVSWDVDAAGGFKMIAGSLGFGHAKTDLEQFLKERGIVGEWAGEKYVPKTVHLTRINFTDFARKGAFDLNLVNSVEQQFLERHDFAPFEHLPEFSEPEPPRVSRNRALSAPPNVARAGQQAGEVWTIPIDGAEGLPLTFVWCPASRFTMGSPASEVGREAGERQAEVTLTEGFWMLAYEVHQGLFRAITGANPSNHQGHADLPVEKVTWPEATDFARRLTAKLRSGGLIPAGWCVRLPTEAELEYAHRGGTTTPFAVSRGGDGAHFLTSRFANIANSPGTTPVNDPRYPPNPWGLRGVHGNVWEWALDCQRAEQIGGVDPLVATFDPSGTMNRRMVRGGSYREPALRCRSAMRVACPPDYRSPTVGFRVVLVPERYDLSALERTPLVPPPPPAPVREKVPVFVRITAYGGWGEPVTGNRDVETGPKRLTSVEIVSRIVQVGNKVQLVIRFTLTAHHTDHTCYSNERVFDLYEALPGKRIVDIEVRGGNRDLAGAWSLRGERLGFYEAFGPDTYWNFSRYRMDTHGDKLDRDRVGVGGAVELTVVVEG
jgi:formylglycine-generating enzyme required for sulfatase activity